LRKRRLPGPDPPVAVLGRAAISSISPAFPEPQEASMNFDDDTHFKNEPDAWNCHNCSILFFLSKTLSPKVRVLFSKRLCHTLVNCLSIACQLSDHSLLNPFVNSSTAFPPDTLSRAASRLKAVLKGPEASGLSGNPRSNWSDRRVRVQTFRGSGPSPGGDPRPYPPKAPGHAGVSFPGEGQAPRAGLPLRPLLAGP